MIMTSIRTLAVCTGAIICFSCSSSSVNNRTSDRPVPVRVDSPSIEVEAGSLPSGAALNDASNRFSVRLDYANPESQAIVLGSCLDTLPVEFELGTINLENRESAALLAGMVDQTCDGQLRAKSSTGFPSKVLEYQGKVSLSIYQFKPSLSLHKNH